MTAPETIALVSLAVVVAVAMVYAVIAHDMPPHVGYVGDFTAGFFVLGLLTIAFEGGIFGLVRLIRYAWGGP